MCIWGGDWPPRVLPPEFDKTCQKFDKKMLRIAVGFFLNIVGRWSRAGGRGGEEGEKGHNLVIDDALDMV